MKDIVRISDRIGRFRIILQVVLNRLYMYKIFRGFKIVKLHIHTFGVQNTSYGFNMDSLCI